MSGSFLGRSVLRLIPPYGRHGKIYLWRPLAVAGVISRLVGRSAVRLVPPSGRQGKTYLWRPITVAGVFALVLGLGAGASYAFIVKGGSATAALNVGSLKPVTVVSAGSPSSTLLPGARGDVVFSVSNPNPNPVWLIGATLRSGSTIRTSTPGCTTTDSQPIVVLSVPSVDLPRPIPANTTTSIHLANAAEMDGTATTNCQGATFPIPLTITVEP